jgi:transposase InsO family protein
VLTERSATVVEAVKLHRHVGRRRTRRFLAEGPNQVWSWDITKLSHPKRPPPSGSDPPAQKLKVQA